MPPPRRLKLAHYPIVRQIGGSVSSIGGWDGCFVVGTKDGAAFSGRKILLATGVVDTLPKLPGLAERWGRCVVHCPYCHGYEVGGGAIGVLATGSASIAQASTLADWGDITFFTASAGDIAPDQLAMLHRRRVMLEDRPLEALEGPPDGPIEVRFADGAAMRIKALFLASRQRVSPLADALGCAIEETPHGALIGTGPDKQTSVPGIYAAGDTARLPTNVTLASADGVLAGAAIHQALIAGEMEQAA
ncbi:MAG TPA: NAD(P)/FAD-dependent oxidoreductase [Allosphingosinicella sp.]|nr:NAD(P)/FAD-dependent oxidoreductase [Allosphingosinicella sp.]